MNSSLRKEKKKKIENYSVRFDSTILLILIPDLTDYINCNLTRKLWYSPQDIELFRECEIRKNKHEENVCSCDLDYGQFIYFG